MRRFLKKLLLVCASRGFFVFIVVLLAAQALWLALSFKYPMLWDEYYHFGLIQYYGHHLNPFITHQPQSLDLYGNVARSPKYLYHYLLSFPYRGISIFTADQTIQVIALRIINIGIFVGGLFTYRLAMLRLTKSKALVHFVLLILVLLPLSPLLAAQVNYDNLQFLLSGIVFYWTFRFIQAKRFEIQWLLLVISVGLLASVVKYTFLPILFAIFLFLAYWLWRTYGKQVFGLALASLRRLSTWSIVGLSVLLLLGVGLSAERFGGNVIKYHTIDPNCAKVLGVERCLHFSPYKQLHDLTAQKQASHIPNPDGPIGFTRHEWFRQLYDQYFTSGTQVQPEQFEVTPALKIPFITMGIAGIIGLICFLIHSPKLIKRPEVQLVLLSMAALSAALWLLDYANYVKTGYPIAIQGRYILPIVPLGMLLGAIAAAHVLPWRKVRLSLAALTILGLLWGGGLLTHIVLSQPYWYWPNQTVMDVNEPAKRILTPLFP